MLKYVWRVALVLMLLLGMLFLAPVGPMDVDGALAEVVEIPLTAKYGVKPLKSGYTENGYEDPSISVTIERGRIYDTNYVVARVKLQNASQIRTAMAQSYYSPSTDMGTTIARRSNAVLAINGDFFSSRNHEGYVARQGKVYRTKCNGDYDVLIIDDKGDLHIFKNATNADIEAFEGTVVNGYTFGPGLVID
ncbi:MAG: phosphodiester glycosidase family protein, partial [Clostridia bacterium]|nr:phosphodiester glycosidase family protein [Clostridia bacterium]